MKNAPVLLVEDDPDIQENLRSFLEEEGYSVHSSANGQEALAFLQAGNAVRVILLDLMMPVMDGYEFLERFFSRDSRPFADVPIIVLSASPDLKRVATQRNLRFVKKPIDLDSLIEALKASDSPRS